MKDFSVKVALPSVFVIVNGKAELISSMVLSTLTACALITFLPQLMSLWMAASTNSRI